MKKITLFIVFILLSITYNYSQQELSNIIFSHSENQTIYFYEYNGKLKVKADYKTQIQAVNEYPEQLIQSVLSATNQKWVNYNTLGGEKKARKKSEKHFKQIKKMDRKKNYFELHHKLRFKIDGLDTVIIKFFFYQEKELPVSGAMVMQKINKRWFVTSRSDLSVFAIMIMRLKTEALKGIILGNSTNQDIETFHKMVSVKNNIELSLFEKEFTNLYLPENINKKELFIDPKTW